MCCVSTCLHIVRQWFFWRTQKFLSKSSVPNSIHHNFRSRISDNSDEFRATAAAAGGQHHTQEKKNIKYEMKLNYIFSRDVSSISLCLFVSLCLSPLSLPLSMAVCVCFGFEFGSSTESKWISITIVDVKAVPTFFSSSSPCSPPFIIISFFASYSFYVPTPAPPPPRHASQIASPHHQIDSDRNGFIFHLNMREMRNGKWFRIHNSTLFYFSVLFRTSSSFFVSPYKPNREI